MNKKNPLTEREIARWVWQILTALNYLHTMKVMHRDMKLENVMMYHSDANGEPICKVTDFGFAQYVQPEGQDNIKIGTPLYMAPEILNENSYDNKIDIWAIGVLTTELLTGHPPFLGKSKEEVYYKICNKEPNIGSFEKKRMK